MKTSDQGRAAYEKLVCEHWPRSVLILRNQPGHPKDGHYRKPEIQWGWEVWQASRSVLIALPVINPEMFNEDFLFGFEKARSAAKAKLEAMGFTVSA